MLEQEYQDKYEFIKELSETISKFVRNIAKIEYELYISTKNEAWKTEFLVVYYVGGAIQVRNVSGNSHGANYEEIAKMLYSSQVFNDSKYRQDVIAVSNKFDFE